MKAIIKEVEEAIQNIIDGYKTSYIYYTSNDGNTWTVRVANHPANPLNITDHFISLVIDAPHEIEDGEGWSINKKSFNEISNQYYLDNCGSFTEQFKDVEEMLNYIIE